MLIIKKHSMVHKPYLYTAALTLIFLILLTAARLRPSIDFDQISPFNHSSNTDDHSQTRTSDNKKNSKSSDSGSNPSKTANNAGSTDSNGQDSGSSMQSPPVNHLNYLYSGTTPSSTAIPGNGTAAQMQSPLVSSNTARAPAASLMATKHPYSRPATEDY